MATQSFKERVKEVAIAQAKIYENVFLKYEYLVCSKAFLQNPYANVFIDPDSEEEMLKHDLFPRDFIYALEAPDSYIGARMGSTSSKSSAYTHEELTALPADQLLNLFIENGLDINDELKSTFTEDELQELFKAEFENLCIGISSCSNVMYFDLAEQTKVIYDEITQSN